MLFVMLNPSTADAERDDPTLRRCIGFARAWRYGALRVGNLFALRSTDPAALYAAEDPIGPDNDASLIELADGAALIVCAWGAEKIAIERGEYVARELFAHRALYTLLLTDNGQPRHPLYVAQGVLPRFWQPERSAPQQRKR